MAFGNDGTLYLSAGNGDVSTYDFGTGTSTTLATLPANGAIGLTYDSDSNVLIYATLDGGGDVDLYSVDAAGTVTPLFSVVEPSGCGGSAQAMEYIGNGKIVVGSTFGCSVIYSIDLNTQTAATLLNPDGFQDNIKSLIFYSCCKRIRQLWYSNHYCRNNFYNHGQPGNYLCRRKWF